MSKRNIDSIASEEDDEWSPEMFEKAAKQALLDQEEIASPKSQIASSPPPSAAKPTCGATSKNPMGPPEAKTSTAMTCFSCGTASDPRKNDIDINKLRDTLSMATIDELRNAATHIGVKDTKKGQRNGGKPRLSVTLASQPHKNLVLLLSFFKIAKTSADQPAPNTIWQVSGSLGFYQDVGLKHFYPSPQESSHTLTIPNIGIIAESLGITLPPLFESKPIYELIMMKAHSFGDKTEAFRSAIALHAATLRPLSRRAPVEWPLPSPDFIPVEDLDARAKEWAKLKPLLPPDCFINMCGGKVLFNLTPSDQAMQAINRKAHMAAGRLGQSLARDRSCLNRYHEYRHIHKINTPPYPVPAAIAANMANYYMNASSAYKDGKGTSIGPGIMASWQHLKTHFGLPVDLEAPVALSLPKHAPSGHNKAEPVPLSLWQEIERKCSDLSDCPLRFHLRNLWMCIASSTRAQDFHRAKSYNAYTIPHAACLFEIAVTKAGEQHIVVALSDSGLSGRIDWLTGHVELFAKLGYSTPKFKGSIESSTEFIDSQMSATAWQALVLKLYVICGLSIEQQKAARITAHSPHSTASSVAAVLQWNDTARSDLGRWAHQGGQSHMPFRYTTRASAINQMYLRSTIIQAISEMSPARIPVDFDIEHMRASPCYSGSIYVGPYTMYNIETDRGPKYDI